MLPITDMLAYRCSPAKNPNPQSEPEVVLLDDEVENEGEQTVSAVSICLSNLTDL